MSSATSNSPSPGFSKETMKAEGSPKDDSDTSLPKDSEEKSPPTAQESTEPPAKEENQEKQEDEEKKAESTSATPADTNAASGSSTPWQAVYSPMHNTYYFFNPETNETTWENPLLRAGSSSGSAAPLPNTLALGTASAQAPAAADNSAEGPESSSSSSSSAATPGAASMSPYNALQAAAIAQGIDPSLAYLDPSLAGPAAGPSTGGAYGATAKFNARTGQFARVDARDPSHLSEFERAKRMSEFYFDVNGWEAQRAQEQEAAAAGEGSDKKRKRPSKKDLERYKEQKKQKKIAKTAWLRT